MKTIIFDFDGTLTKRSNEIWLNIWKQLDALETDQYLYKKHKNKELDYEDWVKEIEKEFIKRDFNKNLLDALTEKILLLDDLDEDLLYLKNRGYKLRIVSGGIDYVIKTLLKDKLSYFDDIRCCSFLFDSKGYLSKIIGTPYDEEGKAEYIKEYIQKHNISPKDIIFVGNGDNDEYVASVGCHTICLNPDNTDHTNKKIWHHFLNGTDNLKDVIKIIESIS